MAATRIRGEDIAGIAIAVMAHVALLAVLVLRREPEPPPPVRKITVTLQGPIAAEAGSPSREEAAAAVAPRLAEEPSPPEAAPAPPPPAVQPRPVPRAEPQRIQPPPRPAPKAAPQPVPAPRAQPRPAVAQPKAAPPRPASPPPKTGPARPSRIGDNFLPPQPKGQPGQASRTGGGSRIGDDFLRGASAGKGKAETPPGPALTPQVRSSLAMAVSRELKPHWQSPQGLEVEKLATTIEWDLKPDGTLDGSPRFISQTGVTQANRPQADRHREQAIRAVRLAAPFALPPQFYAGWKRVRFTFDRKLD
ncbi:hypothetical protein [Novosphingobium sp. TH158]|uniref:hypothetical protein n=1 Tax=Novosphingobium sp. TH158 TaxID=2067455 RepID=UPI000C7C7C0C|nr:hypothetical protein [Novosphingobium sp. TH158]PLK27454.1 hypothetical protein C0V78_11560 [Novosphingobium sp. TH158]